MSQASVVPISTCCTESSPIRAWVRFPLVPGHEWSGTIAEVGDGVTDLAVGERVVCEGMIPCNRCRRCRDGQDEPVHELRPDRIHASGWLRRVRVGTAPRRAPSSRHRVVRLPACSSNRRPASLGASTAGGRGRVRRSASSASARSARWRSSLPASSPRERSSRTACARPSSSSPASLAADATVHVGEEDRRCGDHPPPRQRARPRARDGRLGRSGRARHAPRPTGWTCRSPRHRGRGPRPGAASGPDGVRRHGRDRQLLVLDVGVGRGRPATRAGAARPRSDRHPSLFRWPLRGGIRADGRPRRRGREGPTGASGPSFSAERLGSNGSRRGWPRCGR